MAEKQMWVVNFIKRTKRDGQEKTYFDRVGQGWENKDGSFNFYLDKIPTGIGPDTAFHFAPYKPKEKRESEGFGE